MPRYIDADKHLQKLGERRDTAIIWELNCNDEETKDRAQEAILIFNECILELINAPTADVRENVRGEWEEYRDWKHGSFKHRCSECGYHDNERDDLGTYNFCPHCGAEMEVKHE